MKSVTYFDITRANSPIVLMSVGKRLNQSGIVPA